MLVINSLILQILKLFNVIHFYILKITWNLIYYILYIIPFKKVKKYNEYCKIFSKNKNNLFIDLKKENYVIKILNTKIKNDFNLKDVINIQLKKINSNLNTIKTTIIILKPFKKVKTNNLSKIKMFIRCSKAFTKTRYSIIRQECKNIVAFTLLLNLIGIALIYNIYLKVNINIFFYQSFVVLFIIFNVNWLFIFNNNINLFWSLIFTSYRKWLGFDN